ncbi:hypothetical protein [Actinoplanes sp. M2I2]|uniref:hypothetical protein n=1 Tax=Actinoplanes sp. M2I2 TaxID=1734444 RepID=UPI002020644C|nr:hypothetical protein [Actinoplanes sp. M2I2]
MDGPALPPRSVDQTSDDQTRDDQAGEDQTSTGSYDTGTYAALPGPAAEPAAVSFPRISDYWPEEGETPDAPPQPGRPRRRRRLIAGAAGAVLVLGVGTVALTRLTGGDDPAPAPTAVADPGLIVGATPNPPVSIAPAPAPTPEATPPSTAAPSSPTTPSVPPGPAFEAATFVLASDLTELTVTLGRPARNGVARVGSPRGSGVVPDATLDGTSLRLTAERTGDEGSGQVDVVLDERVAWSVRMEGGVKVGTFAMAGGRVRDFSFEGGADRLELTLPRQERPIGIRMAGGVHRWHIGTEGEFPVKVKLRRGAGQVDLNGDRDRGVDRGETLRARGSDRKSGGLRIEAVAGIGSLSVSPLPDRHGGT